MAAAIHEGLLKVPAVIIATAERTHKLVTTTNLPGPDGKVAICVADLKANAEVLFPVLTALEGKQPYSVSYCSAVHALDKAVCIPT
jgi:hypothetical protein